jgi:hypothetical protein
MRPHLSPTAVTSRPNWMLLAMALPVGMLLDRLTGGWENLSGSILMLMGWLDSPTLLQRHTAGLVSHLVVPTLLVFLVLKATRLGTWLAPNRLALWCLLVADAVVVGLALRGLVLAAIDEPPFVSGNLAAVAKPVVVASLSAGLVALLGSTIWHRLIRDKSQAANWFKSLLREV